MAQQLEVERKIRQLDNDVQSIYEMLATIAGTQNRHGNRLKEISGQVDHLGTRIDVIDTRLDSIDGKLDLVIEHLRDRPSTS